MNGQRILWFQDGVKLRTPQETWGYIDMLTERLTSLTGNMGFENIIVDPSEPARNLFEQINPDNFSCILDLSGSFNSRIREIFPNVPVTSDFHLSRVRVVSSPRLDGSGFLVSLDSNSLLKLRRNFDMRRPLVLDDVAWSGRTILEALRLLGLNPESTTVGLLAANEGNFGEGKPGARELLEKQGLRVISGNSVRTPQDDGFHLADFFNIEPTDETFDVILEIQKAREEKKEDLVRRLLGENRRAIFPSSIPTAEVKRLEADGRFVSLGGISRDSFFDINPPNWIMPSFSKRTNWEILERNKRDIISVLRELRGITREGDPSRETKMTTLNPESSIMKGKERA